MAPEWAGCAMMIMMMDEAEGGEDVELMVA